MASSKLPAYFKEYLDERFRGLEHQLGDTFKIVKQLQIDSKSNHECITSVKTILEKNADTIKVTSKRVNRLYLLFAFVFGVLIVHFVETNYTTGSGIVSILKIFSGGF